MDNYNTYEDYELLVLLKEKKAISGRAFEVLWNRYSNKLMQYCFLNSENKEDADDLFKNTWITFYETIKKEKKISSVKYFLFKIAYNLNSNKKRLENIQYITVDFTELDTIIDEDRDFLKDMENKEIISYFHLALDFIDPMSKEYLLLYWVGGLTFTEIAKMFEEDYEYMRKKCTRAMQKVISILEPHINKIK